MSDRLQPHGRRAGRSAEQDLSRAKRPAQNNCFVVDDGRVTSDARQFGRLISEAVSGIQTDGRRGQCPAGRATVLPSTVGPTGQFAFPVANQQIHFAVSDLEFRFPSGRPRRECRWEDKICLLRTPTVNEQQQQSNTIPSHHLNSHPPYNRRAQFFFGPPSTVIEETLRMPHWPEIDQDFSTASFAGQDLNQP